MRDSRFDIMETNSNKDSIKEGPPLFKRWRSWYGIVLLLLLLLILFFYLFTKHYA